ncbi:MAG: hypothetical protein RLP09_08570 [Sandaracinaceae bacterium]
MTAAPIPQPPRVTRALTAPVRGLDRLRWLWLKALGPLAKPLVRRRELRVAVAGTSLIGLALLGAIFLPMWLLALGPIVWGVPHVLGDVRYLWVRPGHHRRLALSAAVGVSLLILSVTAHPSWGFASAGLAALLARGAWWKKALAAAVAVGLVWVAWRHSFWTAVVFAHAHNLIGVALWWSWRRRMGRLHWLPLAAFVAGGALLLSGWIDPLLYWAGALDPRPSGLDVYYHLGALAPAVPGMLAVRLVLLFCFAQSVHYAVWVRLVPEEDRPRETPRTFAATLRALRADFGAPLLTLAFVAAVGLAGWAAWDVFAARHGYLRAVLFHGHLELVAAALLFVEGTRPRGATERAGQPVQTRDAA